MVTFQHEQLLGLPWRVERYRTVDGARHRLLLLNGDLDAVLAG